jgi:hypothetical protein
MLAVSASPRSTLFGSRWITAAAAVATVVLYKLHFQNSLRNCCEFGLSFLRWRYRLTSPSGDLFDSASHYSEWPMDGRAS